MPRQPKAEYLDYAKVKWPLYDDFVFKRSKNCTHLPYTPGKVKAMLGLKKVAREGAEEEENPLEGTSPGLPKKEGSAVGGSR